MNKQIKNIIRWLTFSRHSWPIALGSTCTSRMTELAWLTRHHILSGSIQKDFYTHRFFGKTFFGNTISTRRNKPIKTHVHRISDTRVYNDLFLEFTAGRWPALLGTFLIITDLKRVPVHSCHCILTHDFVHHQRAYARIVRTRLVGFHFSVQNGTRTDRFALPVLVREIESPLDVYRMALVLWTYKTHERRAPNRLYTKIMMKERLGSYSWFPLCVGYFLFYLNIWPFTISVNRNIQ